MNPPMMQIRTNQHPVFIGDEVFDQFSEWWSGHSHSFSSVFILADTNTHDQCVPIFLREIQGFGDFEILEVEEGEEIKSIEVLHNLWQALASLGADRRSLIINIGGGVITDLGGFLAATYMRGIAYVNFPTSLLAQVDASVGGKTGINVDGIKNLAGSFYPPLGVYIYPGFLSTLDPREIKSGYAEVLKHGLIANKDHFHAAMRLPDTDTPAFQDLIQVSIGIKAEIVERDFKESGLRKVLNFGHTIGHALESYFLGSSREMTHGEAVAFGMMAEITLSKIKGLLQGDIADELRDSLQNLYGRTFLEPTEIDALLDIMRSDKKNEKGEFRFTLLKAPGFAEPDIPVSRPEVLDALKITFIAP